MSTGTPASCRQSFSAAQAGGGALATGAVSEEPAGSRRSGPWRTRGYLPHFDVPGLVQFITFRLHDSVPQAQVEQWKQQLCWRADMPASDPVCAELRRKVELYADAGYGQCYLNDPRVYELVEKALKHFDAERYRLLEWAIMPNHVHVLIEMPDRRLPAGSLHGPEACRPEASAPVCPPDTGGLAKGYTLESIVHSWKSFTAKEANKLLGRQGIFWMREYFDRYIRNERHYGDVVKYIRGQGPPASSRLFAAEGNREEPAGSQRSSQGTPASGRLLAAVGNGPKPAGSQRSGEGNPMAMEGCQ